MIKPLFFDNADPIFIVGSARSGTTLLQYMLRSHPELSFPTSESHFFIPFYSHRDQYGDLSKLENIRNLLDEIYNSRKEFFDDDMPGLDFDSNKLAHQFHQRKLFTIPAIISALFEENAKGEGKSRWGEKTPYYILHLDTIIEMFPNAQIVHLIRDGRDCALSMLERKWDLKIFNIYHAAYLWDRYVKAGKLFGKKHPDRYYEIRYEDILDKPYESIKQLCHFLNIEFNDSVVNFKKSSHGGKTPLVSKPLKRDNQAKWKTAMSQRQLRIFEDLAGEMLIDCGYELSTQRLKMTFWDWFSNEIHIKICNFYSKYLLG